jgi:catechol 2,3-dioxygenase-like lactoylglutathione lyase family enzyme
MRPQPMVVVTDVETSSRWYQRVLGLESGHGGSEYEMLLDGGQLVLQLHETDVHEHPLLGAPGAGASGAGVALWFETDAFDAAVARVTEAGVEPADGPLVNPNAQHREIWLRDPDGYLIVVSSPFGDL